MFLEQISHLILIIVSILGGVGWIIHYLKQLTNTLNIRFQKLQNKLEQKVTQKICLERREQLLCRGSGGCSISDLTKALNKLNQNLENK